MTISSVETTLPIIHMLKGRDTLCGANPFTSMHTRHISTTTCPECLDIFLLDHPEAFPEALREDNFDPLTIHEWFGLSYSNYLVLNRSTLQSTPLEWQHKFTSLLEELDGMFSDTKHADKFIVRAAEEIEVMDLTESQMEELGYSWTDDGLIADDCGTERESWERVLIPVDDPIPHYDKGRTKIPLNGEEV